ncbi:MAG TPA: CRTAC1 family protein, partial [Opitutaceae bacterium]
MPASETGIVTQNDYNDPRIWGERYNEFPVGAIGTGVAVGDYDGDGRPDIFVVSKTESCRLFRNLGHWKFVDVTAQAGVEDRGDAARVWKQGATFVDVNNDGLLDIYVCRFGAPNLLYINQGDGTFREEAAKRGLAINDASGMAAFCDYDGDGWLDVFIQTNILDVAAHPNGQRNYLFHNNGDGTFTDVTEQAGIRGEAHGHSATWWDFDGDGRPDLYVANDFAAPDVLYHNNRDGTFTNVIDRVMPCQPYHSMGADIGDVNNTGRLDLFVGEMARSSHESEYRTIAETRSQSKDDPMDRGVAPQYMRNVLYLNTGTGHFQEAAQMAGLARTDWTWGTRLEDFDNDGRVDLFLTNGMVRQYDNVDLRTRTMLAESSAERVHIMQTAGVETDTHFAYRNCGNLCFENVSKAWGLDQKGASFGAATGDFDDDGDLDIVYTNYQAGLTVLRNDSLTGHRLVVALRGTRSNRFGVGASVVIETERGVLTRTLVLARGYLSSSEPILHFGLGDLTQIKRLTVKWPSGCVQVFHQLDVDRRLTITEPKAPESATAGEPIEGEQPLLFHEVTGERWLSGIVAREADVEETNTIAFSPFRFNRRGPALAVAKTRTDAPEVIVVGGTTLDPERLGTSADRIRFSMTAAGLEDAPGKVNDGPILM